MPKNKDDLEGATLSAENGTESFEVIASAEMEIRTDTSEMNNGNILNVTNKISSTILGVMLGTGVCSLSYLGLNKLDIDPYASFLIRLSLGGMVGAGFGYGMYKAANALNGKGFLEYIQGKNYGKMTLSAIHSSLGAAALGSLGAPLLGTTVEFERNLILAEKLDEKTEVLESYVNDPKLFPPVAAIEADFNSDFISSLDAQGDLTEEAIVKHLIYNDGKTLRMDTDLKPSTPLTGVWEEEINGQKWLIGYFDKDHWVLKGPQTTWWIGMDSNMENRNSLVTRLDSKTRTLLDNSGKMDGKPAIDDLITAAGERPEVGDLKHGIDRLYACAPFEWNRTWREKIEAHADQLESQFVDTYTMQLQKTREEMFGAIALDHEDSYAALLHSILQSTDL